MPEFCSVIRGRALDLLCLGRDDRRRGDLLGPLIVSGKGMMGKGMMDKLPCPNFSARHSAGSIAPLGGQRGGALTEELRLAGVLGDGFEIFVEIGQLVP